MNPIWLILGICILASHGLCRKKRSQESDYWIKYEPIPSPNEKSGSRSQVTILNPEEDQSNSTVVYKDTGNTEYSYPAEIEQTHDANKQVVYLLPVISSTLPTQSAHQICHRALDLGIILDSSYSVEGKPWQEEKKAVQTLIDKLDVHENGTHLAVIVFGTEAEVAIPFNSYKDAGELKQKVESIEYKNGWSRTDLALISAKYQVFTQQEGSRTGIPKALIFLSDGRTDGESLPDQEINWTERIIPAAEDLRKDGVNIFCIGTENADQTKLNIIASDTNNVFRSVDIDMLKLKLESISQQQCYNENNKPHPPQCPPSCIFPSICLLAIQVTCLPPYQQTVTCTKPGACISTAITTASTEIRTSTAVASEKETSTQNAIETSTHTTTGTDTLTETAVRQTASSIEIQRTTETFSTAAINTINSTHVTTATEVAEATSTAIATRNVPSTLLTTSLGVDTSTHVTTATSAALQTSTKTQSTTATDTYTAVPTATHSGTLTTTSTALTTSTLLKTDVSTQMLTTTATVKTTAVDTTTSTQVTIATITATKTSTAVATSTAVTTSTEISTDTQVLTTVETKTESFTQTTTWTSTVMSTSFVAGCTAKCPGTDPNTEGSKMLKE